MHLKYIDGFKKHKLVWLVLFLFSFLLACHRSESGKGPKDMGIKRPSKPNVLLLITEQTEADMIGSYGAGFMHTPNLDQLSKTGFTFLRSYVQEATCEPSRNSFLTGLRPDSIGIYGLGVPLRKTKPHIITMPQFFKEHGYETISIGKVFHDYKHDPTDDPLGWSRGPVSVSGRWQGRGYLTPQDIAEMKTYQKTLPVTSRWLHGKGPAWEEADVADTVYADGKRANRAITQLQQLKTQGKPFFLAVGFIATHLPFHAPKKYWDMYPASTIHLPDNFYAPKDTNRYSLKNSGELRGYSNIPKGHQPIPDSTAKILKRAYQAAISYDDAQIGRVLDALEKLGLRKNTIVVYWSDHGGKVGHHHSWSKHTNYIVDTHVPLIVRVPWMQKTAGHASKGFIESVDAFPALAQLCGLTPPPVLQGRSFVPLMERPDRPWKPAALWQYPREGDKVMGYSMRTKRYHYVEWTRRATGHIEFRELYDLRKDPEENANVSGDKKYKSTIDSLSVLLHKRWKKSLTPGGISSSVPTTE